MTERVDTKQDARMNLVELLRRDRALGDITALIAAVRTGRLTKSEAHTINVHVLSSIKMLREELLEVLA